MIAALMFRCRAFLAHDVLRFATLVAAATFLIDWSTKSWALRTVEHAARPLGSLMLGVERNEAFAFSMGDGAIPPGLVLSLRLIAIAGVLLLSHRVGARNRRFAAGFALLVAGGFGNAADVMFRGGAVVDFIRAGPFHWAGEPVLAGIAFNAADLAIVISLGLLAPLIHEWSIGGQRRIARWEARWLSRQDTE